MIRKHPLYFLSGALLGGAIGAAAALILAPQSGTKMRNQLRSFVLNGKRTSHKKHASHVMTSHEINHNPHRKPKIKLSTAKRPHKKAHKVT